MVCASFPQKNLQPKSLHINCWGSPNKPFKIGPTIHVFCSLKLYLLQFQSTSCAMKVDIHLPSGDGYSVELSPATLISELKAAAQRHFQRRLKLIADGRQLDLTATLSEVGLQDGDVVAAVLQLGQLAGAGKAFAWHGHGGEVVTWGNPQRGAESSQVQKQLKTVKRIQATGAAFAAILESGAVVTWGDPEEGGDSSQVQEQLANVQQIQAVIQTLAETAARCKSS